MQELRRRLTRVASGEEGYLMVSAVVLISIGLMIGAAGLAESLATRSHANLDTRQRRALQAADAGAQAVLYHENQLDLGSLDLTGGSSGISSLKDCLVPDLTNGQPGSTLTATTVGAGGACPVGEINGSNAPYTTTVPVGNHDAYTAEFIPNATAQDSTSGIGFGGAKIVSIGVDDNGNPSDSNRYVYERVEVSLTSLMQASNSNYHADGGTSGSTSCSTCWNSPWTLPFDSLEANHNLTFNISSGTTVFDGTARVGNKLTYNVSGLSLGTFEMANVLNGANVIEPATIDVGCAGNAGPNDAYTITGNPLLFNTTVLDGGFYVASPQTCNSPFLFDRPAISIDSSKADCPTSCASLQGYVGGAQDEIYITNGATLNLAPGDYVFCSFQTNGPVNVTSATGPVRIYIDSPSSSRCSGFTSHSGVGLPSGFQTGAGSFVANAGIGGLLGGVASTLFPSLVQVYVTGNGTPDGTVATTGPGTVTNGFYLYAPLSNVKASDSVAIRGAIIGYDVTVSAPVYDEVPAALNVFADGTDNGCNGSSCGSGGGGGGGSSSSENSTGFFHSSQYVQCDNSVTELNGTTSHDTGGC